MTRPEYLDKIISELANCHRILKQSHRLALVYIGYAIILAIAIMAVISYAILGR